MFHGWGKDFVLNSQIFAVSQWPSPSQWPIPLKYNESECVWIHVKTTRLNFTILTVPGNYDSKGKMYNMRGSRVNE